VAIDLLWESLGISEKSRRDRSGGARIAQIMQRLGFYRSTVEDENGKTVAAYATREKTPPLPLGDE
jgi:hypothetical protein